MSLSLRMQILAINKFEGLYFVIDYTSSSEITSLFIEIVVVIHLSTEYRYTRYTKSSFINITCFSEPFEFLAGWIW